MLAATRPDEADALLARVERSFGGGSDAIPLFDGLARDVREAFGDDAARLLIPLELALLEERQGEMGVLCVVGREPLGWREWASSGRAKVDGEPGAVGAFVAVRRGEEAPFLLLARAEEAAFRTEAKRAPKTGHLFVGHHQRVEVFDLNSAAPKRVADHDVMLFWYFIDHEDLVIAVAETDIFAFASDGTLRWSEFIDPPHVVTRDRDALVIEEQLLGTVRRIRISD